MIKRIFQVTTICLALAVPLSGCTMLALGGATVGGLALTDRRTVGSQTDDQTMEIAIKSQATSYLRKKGSTQHSISVTSYNRNILLLGFVDSEEDKTIIERIARSQQNVRNIYNYINVGGTYNYAMQDSWITSKIRTMLLKPNGFSPNHVKVVTYNGVTYAMGILTAAEQAAATQGISTTAGVQKVVTLYETFSNSSE
ncbi:MAG: BON domain-containing protein [Neisseriaceae bacterium]|nr:BON domain-containing protein [Neisseriaceae bacterium]